MPTTPKPSPQADGTPESLHKAEKKGTKTDAGDEHLGARESQVSTTSPPAGQAYSDEPKQG